VKWDSGSISLTRGGKFRPFQFLARVRFLKPGGVSRRAARRISTALQRVLFVRTVSVTDRTRLHSNGFAD
jgi:hypothetical protein